MVLFLGEYIRALIRPIGTDECIGAFDFSVSSLNLSGIEIIEFERLL